MPEDDKKKELSPEEEFEQAFAAATSADDTEDPAAEPTKETPAEDKNDPVEPKPTNMFQGAPADKPSESGGDDGGGGDDPDYRALYEKEQQRNRSWEGRIEAANRRARELEEELQRVQSQKAQAKPDSGAASPTTGDSGLEDDPELKQFFEEFPELQKPFNKLLEKRGAEVARKVVEEEVAKFAPQFQQITEFQRRQAVDNHFATIQAAHPDWREHAQSGAVAEWIEAQPTFIRDRLTQVAKQGSASEVIELLNSFKASRPARKQSTQRTVSQRMADAEAIPASSGGVPNQGPAKDDFDGAWEEATRKG